MRIQNFRVYGTAVMLALAFALVAGSLWAATSSAQAQEPDERSGRRGIYGTVKSISEEDDTAVISTRSGNEVNVDLSTTDLELSVDDRVALLVQPGAEGEPLEIIRGLVRPDRPRFLHLTGAVVTKTDTGLTIVDATGREHVVELPQGVTIPAKPGELATVIASRGPDRDDEGHPLVAHASVSAQTIADRVRKHVEVIRGRAQAGRVQGTRAEARIKHLAELLETISNRIDMVLGNVLDRVGSERARVAVQSARDKALQGLRRAITRVGQRNEASEDADGDADADALGERSHPSGRPDDAGQPKGTPGEQAQGNSQNEDAPDGRPDDAGQPEGTPGEQAQSSSRTEDVPAERRGKP